MNKIFLILFFSSKIFAQELNVQEVTSSESMSSEENKKDTLKPLEKSFFDLTPEEQQAVDPRLNPYMNGTNPEEIEKMIAKRNKKREMELLPPGAPIRVVPTGKSKEEEDKFNESIYLIRRQEFRINSEYRAGKYLIYDCELKNFVCVNVDSYKLCEEKRSLAKEKGALFYPCAPLKEFISKQICLYKNYEVMKRETEKKFCYKMNE